MADYICAICGGAFPQPVWECERCGHHSDEGDPECGNCHEKRK